MSAVSARQRVAILHYAGPPGVGGVEAVMGHHARLLCDAGFPVRLVVGSGSLHFAGIECFVEPLFASSHAEVLAVKCELDAGENGEGFQALRARLRERLAEALAGCTVCIAHNVATLHKNLALTAALQDLVEARKIRLIAWCHDLAWTNAQYLPELHDGYPWNLLRTAWANTQLVTISEARRRDLSASLGVSPDVIRVVPNGVDPAAFLRLTPTIVQLAQRLSLFDADALLLYPTRLTRRKNVELALEILAALRDKTRQDVRLLVTGPPGPHNPQNSAYLAGLLQRRADLALERSVHFLHLEHTEFGASLLLNDDDVSSLYHLVDALLFPSAQEGFGIPILEAGLAGLPIFCSDLPPLREIAEGDAEYFHPQTSTPATIAERIWVTLTQAQGFRMRHRVLARYRWEAIVALELIPLVEGKT